MYDVCRINIFKLHIKAFYGRYVTHTPLILVLVKNREVIVVDCYSGYSHGSASCLLWLCSLYLVLICVVLLSCWSLFPITSIPTTTITMLNFVHACK